MLNPYFNHLHTSAKDQSLAQSLIIEAIKIHGRDMYYVPREYVALDKLYGEDKLSAFTKAYQLEFYVDLVQAFGGDRDVMSKFGLEIRDEMVLTVAKLRFEQEVTFKDSSRIRPREGDLVYFPFDHSIFEVTFVENEQVFYQTGRLFTFELTMKRFEPAGETFDTGLPVIDDIEIKAYTDTVVFTSGSGNFTVGELITQGTTEAHVIEWDSGAKTLIVNKVKGEFVPSIAVVGSDSGASYIYTVETAVEKSTSASLKDNTTLDDITSGSIDFSERNPISS